MSDNNMRCKECKFLKVQCCKTEDGIKNIKMCSITSQVNPIWCDSKSCEEIEKSNICFNCKHWIGGGDFGLSCAKHYYLTSTYGFRRVCDEYERKENNNIG